MDFPVYSTWQQQQSKQVYNTFLKEYQELNTFTEKQQNCLHFPTTNSDPMIFSSRGCEAAYHKFHTALSYSSDLTGVLSPVLQHFLNCSWALFFHLRLEY